VKRLDAKYFILVMCYVSLDDLTPQTLHIIFMIKFQIEPVSMTTHFPLTDCVTVSSNPSTL